LRTALTDWFESLRYNPIPFLLGGVSPPLRYFIQRDLLEERVAPVDVLWRDIDALRILARQSQDGRWRYPGGGTARIRSTEDYDQLETYRELGILVEKFGFHREYPGIRKAAAFIFRHQTDEGDFRGIYGRQYTPNYSAAIMELLIKAGYGDDPRITKGFRWLLSMRQDDGGWAIPLRTLGGHMNLTRAMHTGPNPPDRSKPSSHLATGMVLRSFAADADRSHSEEARSAGRLLAARFFKRDYYIDRGDPDFWWRVSFPFWFTDIVSALDSLSRMGFNPRDPAVANALAELKARQLKDGSFDLKLLRTRDKELALWVGYAMCRVFKRFYSA